MKSRDQNNWSGRRGNRALISQPIFFALIVAIILLFIQFFFPRVFPSIFSYFFSPIWSSKNSIVLNLTPTAKLAAENQTLEQELAEEKDIASSSKALLDQNNELKSLLGRSGNIKNLVLANVLRRPPGAGYDYMIVDAGLADKVAVGNYAYSTGSVAIGQVVEVDLHSSKVELYSSPGTNYDVLIGASHIPAVASGQGGGSFSTSLSQESGASVGDEVIMPAVSSSPFGYVSAVISDPARPFEKVLWSEGINPYQSLFLLVETNEASSRSFVGLDSTTSVTSAISATSSKK